MILGQPRLGKERVKMFVLVLVDAVVCSGVTALLENYI